MTIVTDHQPSLDGDAGAGGAEDLPAELPDPPLRQGLEALLFLADEPLDVATLADALQVDGAAIEAALDRLATEYVEQQRGMEIRRAAGGWRMYSADGARPVLERWALVGRSGRLTQAALETLAVIAYKQPIGRQDIGDIRGVNADGAVRSLVARGYVQEVGRDSGPGQAVLYGTTASLLERLGLDSIEDLPPLTDYLPEAPAPDEPALGALKEIRRRLAAGENLPETPSRGGAASSRQADQPSEPSQLDVTASVVTGDDLHPDPDDDVLPPPEPQSAGIDEGEMDELTDKLERAARSAVDRLRQAVAAESETAADDGRSGGEDADDA